MSDHDYTDHSVAIYAALDSLYARTAENDTLVHAQARVDLTALTAEREAAVAERDALAARLQHFIECADTPLMRDVLAERDALKAAADSAHGAIDDWLRTGLFPSREMWYAIRDGLSVALAAEPGEAS